MLLLPDIYFRQFPISAPTTPPPPPPIENGGESDGPELLESPTVRILSINSWEGVGVYYKIFYVVIFFFYKFYSGTLFDEALYYSTANIQDSSFSDLIQIISFYSDFLF